MREFVITTDSTVDLPKEYLSDNNVAITSLSYIIEGETYLDMDGLTSKEFFDRIRSGAMPTTSQVNPDQAKEVFENCLKKGQDIVHIGFASALSGSYNSAVIAAQELAEEYPEAKIHTIDSRSASMGQGILVRRALALRAAGKSADETAAWVEQNKLHICHNLTVDDLNHLHRGGRISKATAVLGSMVKIKPILIINDEGKLEVVGKERGRKKSLVRIVEMMMERIGSFQNEEIMITHGDCEEDAKQVAELVRERLGEVEIMIHPIGKVLGSHTGPGVVAVFFMGEKR